MLIAEMLSLIAIEPTSGKTQPRLKALHQPKVLVAALVTELAAQLRVGLNQGRVVVLDQLPSRHPLLTMCLRQLSTSGGRWDVAQTVNKLASAMSGVRNDLLEGLVRRDVLHPAIRKYKIFGEKYFPVRSSQAQNEGLQMMHRAALGEETSMVSLGTLGIGVASGALDRLLPFDEAESAKARLRSLREEINAELEQARASTDRNDHLDELYAISLMSELEIQVKIAAHANGR